MNNLNTDDFVVEEFLAHYGVKGMKWGVRKKYESSGESRPNTNDKKDTVSSVDKERRALVSSPKKVSKTEQEKNLNENHKKFLAKLGDDSPKEKGSEEKSFDYAKAAKIGLGAAAAGAIIYGGYKYKKYLNHDPMSEINVAKFEALTTHSKLKTWSGQGYITPTSFDRPEFSLEPGHTFFRLSKSAENGFRQGTYCTASKEDLDRYIVGFRKELGGNTQNLKLLSFKATEPVKVPNLNTVLDSLQEVMAKELGYKPSQADVISKYNNLSGGPWDNKYAAGLFSNLKSKGYGAIVDEMDAGVIGHTPLVLFTDKVSDKIPSDLTADRIKEAAVSLLELPSRKP